jgi:hypothetical protein
MSALGEPIPSSYPSLRNVSRRTPRWRTPLSRSSRDSDVGPGKTVKATLISASLYIRSWMSWDVSLVPSCLAIGESLACTKMEMVGGSMGVVYPSSISKTSNFGTTRGKKWKNVQEAPEAPHHPTLHERNISTRPTSRLSPRNAHYFPSTFSTPLNPLQPPPPNIFLTLPSPT